VEAVSAAVVVVVVDAVDGVVAAAVACCCCRKIERIVARTQSRGEAEASCRLWDAAVFYSNGYSNDYSNDLKLKLIL
jgi:hypothetical protein